MLKTRFEWTLLMLAVALLGGAWIVYSRVPPAASTAGLIEAPLAGHLAPDFVLASLNGEEADLSEYQGRPVVLNFWATWCLPCRAEIPHLQAASVEYNGRVVIVGVNQGEDGGTVGPYAAEMGVTYPLLLDEDGRVNQLYSVNALPTTVFISEDGVVQEIFLGILSQGVLEDRIEALIQEE
jgi:thiol-disulfide isomerase/thioredoxin